ncbi:MAG: hypothetical protein Tsb0033_08740 [Winogradskyella sp.]
MISVITGDIINSRSALDQNLWLQPLKEALTFVTKDTSKYEIYRGDSFQLEVEDIKTSFTKAIYLKACIKAIKGFDVRLAIGIGDTTYRAQHISESNGTAYLNSGEMLDSMKKTKINLRIKSDFRILPPTYNFDKIFNLYFRFASVIMDHWTVNSAEAVKLLIETDYGHQKVIAEKIGINQDAVSKRLTRANIDEILELNELYEDHINKLTYKNQS